MNILRPFLLRMIIFLLIVIAVCAVLYSTLSDAFLANPALNGLILGVLIIGIIFSFRQVIRLAPEVAWLTSARINQPGHSVQRAPRLLAPLATIVAERRERVSLSAVSMRSVLDGIGSRLDESHDLARYLIGLLIFLGLLGTFWGLLQTVTSVGDVIGTLSVKNQDLNLAFDNLKGGLEAPLAGMGTAFSSSLFGLAGSLILGFLELQASQAQNRFYNDLEDWLSSYTRLTGGSFSVEGDSQSVPAYVSALLERTADSLDELQRTLVRDEDNRTTAGTNLLLLTEHLAKLTDQMTEWGRQPTALDEASRTHLRNLDIHVGRLLEEISSGRDQAVNELRSEIKLLARTIAATAENKQRDRRG